MTDTSDFLFLNGAYMPLRDGCISVEDRGFQFADGVYETVRVVNGRAFRTGDHLRRLSESALGIHLPLAYSAEEMESVCHNLIERSQLRDGMIYIQVTRGVARRSHLPLKVMAPTTLAYTQALEPMPPDQWARGVSVLFRKDDRWGHCDLKTIGLLGNVLGRMEAQRLGADDVIFHGEDGTVYECSSANVFCIRGGTLFTPPLSPHILAGVTRTVVMEACGELAFGCREEALKTEDYLEADEVFMTSTTRNALPIRLIDGKKIGNGDFSVARRINAAIQSILDRETREE